tara:strand:+ start:933 stop:1133 length:201 start_codon:yes stop_codon:yes gene_type:complete
LNFFGYSAKDRVDLHNRLYDLLEVGQGKWDWNTIYHLPIPVRRLWITRINQRAHQQEETKKQSKKS